LRLENCELDVLEAVLGVAPGTGARLLGDSLEQQCRHRDRHLRVDAMWGPVTDRPELQATSPTSIGLTIEACASARTAGRVRAAIGSRTWQDLSRLLSSSIPHLTRYSSAIGRRLTTPGSVGEIEEGLIGQEQVEIGAGSKGPGEGAPGDTLHPWLPVLLEAVCRPPDPVAAAMIRARSSS
jgi:hypothetical protein